MFAHDMSFYANNRQQDVLLFGCPMFDPLFIVCPSTVILHDAISPHLADIFE